MAVFSTLRRRVSTYISPARTDRDRSSSSTASSTLTQQLDGRSMSPTTRAKDWLARTPPSTDSTSTRTPSVLGVQGSRVTKHVSVQSTTTSPAASEGRDWRAFEHPFFNKKVAGKDDDEDYVEDVEDSTLLEEEEEEDDGGKLGNDTTLVEEQDESEDDDELGDKDLKISQAEQDAIVDFEAERAKRTQAAAEIEQGDWSEEEVALFQKLCLRGCEPLLPGNWRMDFKTIPPVLFTVDEDEEAFLGPASGRDFRATKALTSLFSLGVRARDQIDSSHRPEETIRREIESYIRWSELDGDIASDEHIPILAISTAKADQSTEDVIDSVTVKLHRLAGLYRDNWRIHPSVEESGHTKKEDDTVKEDEYEHDLPTLYGIVVAHTVVAFVTHTADTPDEPVRSIAVFDFSDAGYDVWNAFAVAILVVIVRNYLMDLQKIEGRAAEEKKRSDPDA